LRHVANLLLVRVEARRQGAGVRAALGASRGRISADLLLESVILGLLGSAVGLGLAYARIARSLAAIAPAGLPAFVKSASMDRSCFSRF